MDKRKWGTLLLAGLLGLSLVSCGSKGGGSSSSDPDHGSASLPDESSISVIAPVDDVPEHPYTNPLTGEGLDQDISTRRPIAIMINNLRKSLPQLGVSKADVIYEIVAEGGITRMMAVFQDLEGVGELGSVRSARDYYVNLAVGHDAIYIHAGGSPQAYEAFSAWTVSNIDFVNGPYGKMCWRDPERRKTAGLEHSLLTSSEKILEQMPNRFSQEHETGYKVGWSFDKDAPAGGQPAAKLTVPFSNYKTGYFTYDGEKNQYLIQQHIDKQDISYVDGSTGEAVAVENVLVLYTDVSRVKGDSAGRMEVRTTGNGDGLLLRDGQLYEITWRRDSRDVCFSFLDKSGKDIPLAIGSSYINLLAADAKVEWE